VPTFIVVAGANGAPKSTLTRLGREGVQAAAGLDPDAIARTPPRDWCNGGSAIDAGREVPANSD
jgi:predicted ABC-type ATPase